MEMDSDPRWRNRELADNTVIRPCGGASSFVGFRYLPADSCAGLKLMLRHRGHQDQVTLWDLVVPVDLLELPEELAKVDQWLDDERFFKPYLKKFNQRLGRPSVPVETFLRLIYLRHRYGLSYGFWSKKSGIAIPGASSAVSVPTSEFPTPPRW